MTWPKTGEELKELGWRSDNWGTCRACDVRILWAINPETDRKTPLEPLSKTTFQPHHINCPYRDKFKGQGSGAKYDAEQRTLFKPREDYPE